MTNRLTGKHKWRYRTGVVIFVYLLNYFLFGYHFIFGKVVDEETGQPIKGAVVLGVWTYIRGIGFTITSVYQKEDAITDDQGRFFIWGVWNPFMSLWNPFVEKADLTIYKRGYVAWNNRGIFNDGPRKDFRWKNGIVAKMEKWKEGCSFNKHESFISWCTFPGMTKRFAEAMEWERLEQVRENDRYYEKFGTKGMQR